MSPNELNALPNVYRIENCPVPALQARAFELTHAVYPHDELYGTYCTLETHIDSPADMVFDYLANGYNLAEWTYSLREFKPTTVPDQLVATDMVGNDTFIYCKTLTNKAAMTVDYHCAWDQGEDLWMIYLMRIIPAPLVLKKRGCVVIWTNCRHPYYDANPYPDKAPPSRHTWVGDLWPFFYAGHYLELQNLKHILEARYPEERL